MLGRTLARQFGTPFAGFPCACFAAQARDGDGTSGLWFLKEKQGAGPEKNGTVTKVYNPHRACDGNRCILSRGRIGLVKIATSVVILFGAYMVSCRHSDLLLFGERHCAGGTPNGGDIAVLNL